MSGIAAASAGVAGRTCMASSSPHFLTIELKEDNHERRTRQEHLCFNLFRPAVQIYTPMHPMNAELRRKQEFGKPIKIGSDVWVGGGAMICPGVKIGSKTVIGAGSVVTRDIPDGVFAAGNPCRVIRDITE